jgi:hypothetical protein
MSSLSYFYLNRQYFVSLQNKLESLFKQESILIYFTPVLNLLSE